MDIKEGGEGNIRKGKRRDRGGSKKRIGFPEEKMREREGGERMYASLQIKKCKI